MGTELPGPAQQWPQAATGVLAADVRSVGPQQRRERRNLDRDVRPRDGTDRVAFENRPARPAGRLTRDLFERVEAPAGISISLGVGDRRLPEKVDGARHAVLPQAAKYAERGGWRL